MGTREGRSRIKVSCVLISLLWRLAFSQPNSIIGRSEVSSSAREDRSILVNPSGLLYHYYPYLLSPRSTYSKTSSSILRPLYKSYYDDLLDSNSVLSSCSNYYTSPGIDDSGNHEYCTSAINCLRSAAISLMGVSNDNALLQSFIRLGSSVLHPTCLYLSKEGQLKDGICCRGRIQTNSIRETSVDIKSNINSVHISYDKNEIHEVKSKDHPSIDRGHIFARPDYSTFQNLEFIRPASTPSSSENIDYYPFDQQHPTHPPLPTHPPELTNKPWWTTKSNSIPTTPQPNIQHDWWEIRKTVIPQWWETEVPKHTTKATQWWQPVTSTKPTMQTAIKTTSWWEPSTATTTTTTQRPPTQIWQRKTTAKKYTTTTSSTSTVSTTISTKPTTPLNQIGQGTDFCSPSLFKSDDTEIMTETEENPGRHRITGGSSLSPHSYPWIAVLFQGEKHVCGGSLIDDIHILTAAHCVASLGNYQLRHMTVYLGMHDLTRTEGSKQAYSIKTVVKHKDYSRSLLYNDIAILTLNEKVIFTDEVHPICLYEGSSSFYDDFATVAGWGSLFEGGNQLDTPRKVELRIWSNENCGQTYGTAAPGGIISSHLCAGKLGKDACSGDSGGPIIKKINGVFMQIGIVSWGIGCGKGHYPGVYSRISSFLPWIRKVQASY